MERREQPSPYIKHVAGDEEKRPPSIACQLEDNNVEFGYSRS